MLAEYSDKFLFLRDVLLSEWIPAEALRTHDARDRFAVILPRSNSFVRHLARRPEPSLAVSAMTQSTSTGDSPEFAKREDSLVGG